MLKEIEPLFELRGSELRATPVKFAFGKYYLQSKLTRVKNSGAGNSEYKIEIRNIFHRGMLNEVKVMRGARWHPEGKYWSVDDCDRNWFQFGRLLNYPVYQQYDRELYDVKPNRDVLRPHQIDMFRHAITRKTCIFACEMGTGKTLACIETMEYANEHDDLDTFWFVGPLSGS